MAKKRGKPHNPKPIPKEPAPQKTPTYVSMHFCTLADHGAPPEGALVLVRLNKGEFVAGRVLGGRFAAYDRFIEEYVTMAHPERITHWMEIVDPVPRAVLVVDEEREAAFQSQGEAPD